MARRGTTGEGTLPPLPEGVGEYFGPAGIGAVNEAGRSMPGSPHTATPFGPPNIGRQGRMQQQPPGMPQGQREREMRDLRPSGPGRRQFRKEIVAWRPTSIYVPSMSGETTIGLGCPPGPGGMLRRIAFKLPSDFDAHADNYWTIGGYVVDLVNGQELLEDGEVTTETTGIQAGILFAVFNQSSGVRVEPNHEAIVKFTPSGAAAALTQVRLYADWLVGI